MVCLCLLASGLSKVASQMECDLLLELKAPWTQSSCGQRAWTWEPATLFLLGNTPAHARISTSSRGPEQAQVLAGEAANDSVAVIPAPRPLQSRREGLRTLVEGLLTTERHAVKRCQKGSTLGVIKVLPLF